MAPVILLADDSPTARAVLKLTLTKNGFEVGGEANNGEEMVEMYQRLHPDLVITDLAMPKLNGIQAIKRIRELNPQARILVCSSHAATSASMLVNEALKVGACGYVSKSGDKEALVAAVKKALGEI